MAWAIHTLLSRTAHVMQNDMRPYLQKLGLSPGQPKVLRHLATRGPCSQRTLADACEVDPAAISRMLEGLERNGFLLRRPSQSDRRSGAVELTDRGREALSAWEGQLRELEERMLRDFTPRERAQLADLLERAYHNMGGRLKKEE